MAELCKIVHNDYERISDRVMWLAPEWVLRFNVDLFITRVDRHTKDRIKENYHKEYGYTINGKYAVKINRDFSYYLSIECTRKDSNGIKPNVKIGPNSIYFLRFKLDQVLKEWFQGKETIFAKYNGKIFLPTKPDPIVVKVDYGAKLEFEPAIVLIDGIERIGVNIFVNSDTQCFFMDVNTLLSFNYMISNFNMYLSAQEMLNYIGRPYNGTNYTEVQSNSVPQGFFNRINQNGLPGE